MFFLDVVMSLAVFSIVGISCCSLWEWFFGSNLMMGLFGFNLSLFMNFFCDNLVVVFLMIGCFIYLMCVLICLYFFIDYLNGVNISLVVLVSLGVVYFVLCYESGGK